MLTRRSAAGCRWLGNKPPKEAREPVFFVRGWLYGTGHARARVWGILFDGQYHITS